MIRKGMFISDRYEVIDKVGSGGMSDVYKAKDHKLGRFVAVKVLKSEFSDDTGFVSKFKVEAQSAAGLTHPNIVNVYDVGEDNGIYYIVMELIDGITLKKYIEKKGKLPAKEAVSIAIQVAQGIEAAHNNHIIHRDIKPQNIMISREGKVKVTDFGIARAASTHTINGNAMGSVHYISPEQAKGGYIDEKSDIYSLGISLYEMITSEVPFEGDSTVSVALQHINEDMPSVKQKVNDVPISIEKIIAKCTQKKPEDRYLKISALIADLKKSLITPDEDFVQLTSLAKAADSTVIIDKKEISVINEKSKGEKEVYETDDEDELTDDDDLFDEEDIDAVSPKLDKVIAIAGIVGAVVVAIVVILILLKAFGACDSEPTKNNENPTIVEKETISDRQTRVPDVVGKEEEEAINILKEANLGFKIEKRESSNTVPKGCVIFQSEKADSVVDKNSTIKLTISEGPKEFKMPDVVGMPKDEAIKLLEGDEYGLVVSFEYEPSEEVEAEKVIKSEPQFEEKAKWGDKVTITVSQGTDTSDVKVPDLKNKTVEEAEEMLKELGLKIKVVKEVNSTTVKKGNIVNQTIVADKTVPRGTEIEVVVSKGEEETTEPATEPATEEETTASYDSTAAFTAISAKKFDKDALAKALEKETDAEGNELETSPDIVTAQIFYTSYDGKKSIEESIDLAALGKDVYSEDWELVDYQFTEEAKIGSEAEIKIFVNGIEVYSDTAKFIQ